MPPPVRTFVAILLASLCAVAAPGQPPGQPSETSPPVQVRVQRALGLLAEGRPDEAEAIFEGVVAEDPSHGTARLQLGRLALERGDLAAARRHLEIAVDSDPQRLYLARFLLGRVALAEGDEETALVAFEAALESAPGFAPARLGRAEALLLVGRDEEALAAAMGASRAAATGAAATLLAGELLSYLGRSEEARALLEPLAATEGEAGGHDLAARAYLLALDGSASARRDLRVLLGRNLSRAAIYRALALDRRRRGASDEAVAALQIARALEAAHPMTRRLLEDLGAESGTAASASDAEVARRFARALELRRAGRQAEAVALARAIVGARPRHVPARLLVLEEAEEVGDLWTALAGYRSLLEWLPELPALESRLADLAHAMGAHELARCAAETALRAFPDEGALHYRMGTILAAQGDSAGAVEQLERAVETGFGEAAVWLSLGRQYLERMEPAAAIRAYRRALELDPDAAEAIGSFALSSLAQGGDEELRDLLEVHAAAHPGNAETQYGLGVLALREGEAAAAVEHLEAAAEGLGERAQVHYNLALAYRRLGRSEAATSAMERFRQLERRGNELWEKHNRWHRLRLDAEEAAAAGEPGRALELYRQVMAEGGAEVEDSVAAGRAALAAGEAAEARRLFDAALETSPYHSGALEGLAASLEALGEDTGATAVERRLELLEPPC